MNYFNKIYFVMISLLFVSIPAQGMENKDVERFNRRREQSSRPLTKKEIEQSRLKKVSNDVTLKDIEQFNREQEADQTIELNTKKSGKYYFFK